MVVTKQIYFSPTFWKLWVHISDNIAGTKRVTLQRRKKGSFPLSNNYVDDVFTLEELLGLKKNIAKNIFLVLFKVPHCRWTPQYPIEIPIIFFMLFSLLNNQPFCFWRNRNGNAAALFFCVIPAIAPNIEYIKIRLEKFNLMM